MNHSLEFLPDLGEHFLSTNGRKEVRIAGNFDLRLISWYGNEYRSITGACHVDGLDYITTLDFSKELWGDFAQLLAASLYLEYDEVNSSEKVIAKPIEPGLPVWIDLSGSPQGAAESAKTGETFVPIGVRSVFGLRIVPDSKVLQKRHDWYLKLSRELLDAFGEDATTLRKCIRHRFQRIGQFETEEFHGNLVACFLIRLAIGGDPVEEALEIMRSQNGIEFSSIPKSIRSLRAIRENVGDKKDMLTTGFMSLLIWHLAMKINAGAASPSIEGNLVIEWGPNYEDAISFVNMARYCLARNEQPSFRTDRIEKEIRKIEKKDSRVSAMIKSRISEFPDAVWQHPELSQAVNAYARYSVMIELPEKGKASLVTDEMLSRCRQNVAAIADWWYMFTPSEEQLFPLT